MDLKQLEYIVEIANEKNITRAAKKLYITQSALTQQLLKLEDQLHTQLFFRTKNNWRLTAAGEVYVENAHKILQIKQDTYRTIADITDVQQGNLSVGFTAGRGPLMFANVYPKFHYLYPEITVHPNENFVTEQQQLIAAGDLDIGFLALSDDQGTGLKYIELNAEEIFLITPRDFPLISDFERTQDFSVFNRQPFVLISKKSTLRPIVDQIFNIAGFVPKILFETAHTPTILTMVQHGLCCGIVSQYYTKDLPDNILVYSFPHKPKWKIYACYRSNSYLSKPAKDFIQLAREYWLQ